MMMIPLNIDE